MVTDLISSPAFQSHRRILVSVLSRVRRPSSLHLSSSLDTLVLFTFVTVDFIVSWLGAQLSLQFGLIQNIDCACPSSSFVDLLGLTT